MGMYTSDRPVLVIFLQDDSYSSGRKSEGTPLRLCRRWSFSLWPCCSYYWASPAGGGVPGRELGWEAENEVKVPLQLAASAFPATSFLPESASTPVHYGEEFLCRL